MHFTKEQSDAVAARGKNICVAAGAGSGKTAVLVHRFIDEVTRYGVPVDQILAITFTNKAAFEMKSRIAHELRKRGLTSALRALEGAYISTIDSFCARVLRENPIEAGIDPQFAVVDENEKLIAVNNILDETMEYLSRDEACKLFFYQNGTESVADAVKAVFEELRMYAPNLADESQAPRKEGRSEYYTDLLRTLESICLFKEGDGGKHKQRFESVDRCLEKLKHMHSAQGIRWEDYEDLKSLSANGRITVPVAKADLGLRAAVEGFRESRDKYLACLVEEFGESDYFCFNKVVEVFRSRYEEWKSGRRLLDFPDLLMKALELFSSDTYCVRSVYRKKFRLIMLDEFQDTNPLQNRIVDQISSMGNVFVVGDALQSIYGFRNANVDLFEQRKALLKREDSEGGVLTLKRNFRTRKELLGFVNDLFEEIAAGGGGSPASQRLEPDPGLQDKFPATKEPCVEWIVARSVGEDGEEETKKLGRFKEAKMLAQRLRRLVKEDQRAVYDKKEDKIRACRFQDMAILLRTRTALPVIERALKEEGVPYFAVSGNSFFYQTEVRDMVSFLTILENPTYDIPLAGVLRSPFVGCSDDALFWLGQYARRDRDKSHPLINAVEDFERIRDLSEDDHRRIAEFLARYKMLLDEKRFFRTSELIHRVIQLTRYDTIVLGDWNGKLKVANLRKLVDLAERYEEGEMRTTKAFIRHLKDLYVKEVEESEAQIESEDDDVVKIITIHKAKGLEFPIVALADLGYKESGKNDSFAEVDRAGKVCLKVKNPNTGKREQTLSYKKFKEENSKRERAESQRLFYVGATRARDLLIFSGVAKTGEHFTKSSYAEITIWMEWLRKAFDDQMESRSEKAHVLDYKGHAVKLISSYEERSQTHEDRQTFRADSNEMRMLFEGSGAARAKPGNPGRDDLMGEAHRIIEQTDLKIRPYFETVDIAATSLLSYEMCPQLFYYRHVVQWPECVRTDEMYDHERRAAEDGLISRTDLGNIVHGMLEKMSFNQAFRSQMVQRLDVLSLRASKAVVQKVRNILEGLVNNSVFGELCSARNIAKEFKFALRLRYGIVSGAIDLLYENAKGEITIADYKTADIDEEEIPARALKYRTQLMVYALAIAELKRRAPKTIKLIFLNERFTRAFDFTLQRDELNEELRRIDGLVEQIALQNFRPATQCPCAFCVSKDSCQAEAANPSVVST